MKSGMNRVNSPTIVTAPIANFGNRLEMIRNVTLYGKPTRMMKNENRSNRGHMNETKNFNHQVVANDVTHVAFQAGQFHNIAGWEIVGLYISNINPVSGDVYKHVK